MRMPRSTCLLANAFQLNAGHATATLRESDYHPTPDAIVANLRNTVSSCHRIEGITVYGCVVFWGNRLV